MSAGLKLAVVLSSLAWALSGQAQVQSPGLVTAPSVGSPPLGAPATPPLGSGPTSPLGETSGLGGGLATSPRPAIPSSPQTQPGAAGTNDLLNQAASEEGAGASSTNIAAPGLSTATPLREPSSITATPGVTIPPAPISVNPPMNGVPANSSVGLSPGSGPGTTIGLGPANGPGIQSPSLPAKK